MPKSAREIIKILKKNGFVKTDQNGSHLKMYNPITHRITIVPLHTGDVPIGTKNAIWKQAGLK
ncbi:type II toxin-antitoxin system HicA family toxin [Enterococcus sp. DIV0212c]|uniref:type II toxin-antitoxin system HicA family toxin n=1 Tax=Enterococcus sp. DIV0212c TaxID=2230867 RepID=UPI001A9C0DE1|nr:type II toxin-antitoxin system HicA family toxin [Enterococcus sp. DIV0212c]